MFTLQTGKHKTAHPTPNLASSTRQNLRDEPQDHGGEATKVRTCVDTVRWRLLVTIPRAFCGEKV